MLTRQNFPYAIIQALVVLPYKYHDIVNMIRKYIYFLNLMVRCVNKLS